MAASVLPLHHQRRSGNSIQTGSSKRTLRLTEKYVLAISIVAFSLVLFGAFYLPQDQFVRTIRDLGDVQVIDQHKHNADNGEGHRDVERGRFKEKVQRDSEIQDIVNQMEQKLKANEGKIKDLNYRLQSLKTIRESRPGDVEVVQSKGKDMKGTLSNTH